MRKFYCYAVKIVSLFEETLTLVKQETAERKNTPNKIWKNPPTLWKNIQIFQGRHRFEYKISEITRRGRGHWAVYYPSPQSFIITFSYLLASQLWGRLFNFNRLVHWVECPHVSTIIVIYSRDNFVQHNWECIFIYWPCSYPWKNE